MINPRVDRLGRSLQDLVAFLSELHALKVDLFLHQQGFDTSSGLVQGVEGWAFVSTLGALMSWSL